MAIEPSGDIVAAGSTDPFDIYLWSLRTGQLLEVLSSHTAPVSSLSFSPGVTEGWSQEEAGGSLLASASWDQTVKVWDIFGKQGLLETLEHSSEVTDCQFHPTNKDELVTNTLSGQVFIWDSETSNVKGFLECRNDIAGGRLQDDRNTAKNSTKNKSFNSVAMSPAFGDLLVGGGNSKNICLYDIKHKVMLARFAITQNRSLDGVLHKLNSKNVKEGGML